MRATWTARSTNQTAVATPTLQREATAASAVALQLQHLTLPREITAAAAAAAAAEAAGAAGAYILYTPGRGYHTKNIMYRNLITFVFNIDIQSSIIFRLKAVPGGVYR